MCVCVVCIAVMAEGATTTYERPIMVVFINVVIGRSPLPRETERERERLQDCYSSSSSSSGVLLLAPA